MTFPRISITPIHIHCFRDSIDNIYSSTSMAIPHNPIPEGYGNHDTRPRWEIGSFRVGDIVECYKKLNGIMQPSKPDCGIISFVSGSSMSVTVGCNSEGRAVNVCVNQLYNIRILKEHEYTKLATSLQKGCQTNSATSNVATGKEENLTISHTLEKRIETYPLEAKSY